MKNSHMNKYNSSTIYYFIINSLFICYVLILTVSLFTTNTVAYYSNHTLTNGSMTIGTWSNEESERQGTDNETTELNKEIVNVNEEIKSEQKVKPLQTNESMKETRLVEEKETEPKIQTENTNKTDNKKGGE
ncbi:hypothetical protein JOC75_002863 [Metabacillus crassostreae]|uniref:hypothetical protein n=1 Tax=Metabacillus crassostreae TaxID=929098 RepID=UPI0019591413|nr:hypothetical protein [Metabacillus crassostreae]MBM7604859.1 hypothetical protein [Metabacillus crassostreae]